MSISIPVLVMKETPDGYVIDTANEAFRRLMESDDIILIDQHLGDVIKKAPELKWLDRYSSSELALIEIGDQWFEVEVLESEGLIAFIHHNLTPQVVMDNSNKRLQTRINQIQRIAMVGDWERDFSKNEEFWSDEIYRMLGFKDRAIQPNVDTFLRFVHPDDLDEVQNAHDGIESGGGYEIEFRIITIEGLIRWMLTKAKVEFDSDKKLKRLYGTMQDITERKKMEQKVEQAFNAAEEAYQSKSQFLAMISHEVRTPLNGIMGMAQLMKNTIMDEEQSEFVDDIMFSSEALLNIVEDILEMSKMESNILEADSEEFDLHILMRNIVRMYQLKKQDKPVRFIHRIDPQIPQYVWGDAIKLQQILVNLLGNAFKFTEQGRVSLTIRVLEDDVNRSKITFEVEDTGIGISQQMQEEIFDRYVQGDVDIQKKYGGTGLGLSISKNYAELMNGYLFVESEINQGTKFTLSMTFEKSKSLELEKSSSILKLKMKAMHVKVLVVEGDEINRSYLNNLLHNVCGFKVDFVETVSAVTHALENRKYQFVMMDTHLSVETGVFITRAIRESLKMDGNEMPIIAMTTDHHEDVRDAFMSAGVSYYIEKPVGEDTLMEIIYQILDMNAIRKYGTPRNGYRYINIESLEKHHSDVGRHTFKATLNELNDMHQDIVARILAAVSPLNQLMLSHEINGIDDLVTNFGTDDICESLEMIKSALLNEDTGGIDVIVIDFMDEFECFVNELQDYLADLTIGGEKH